MKMARWSTGFWLPLTLFAAALAGSPAARGNCCGDDGGSESYGTNTDPVAGCIIKSWLTKNHKVMGEDACGCEEGHTPGSAITCCDVSLSVEWTQQCTPSDGGSRTVYTGHVYSNDTQVGTLTLAGLVVRPEGGGCTGGGCGGANGPQQGQAQAISPYLKHRVSLGPRSGALSIEAAEPDMELSTPAGLDLIGDAEEDVDLVCQGDPPMPKQVFSASGLADIVVESDTAYRIDFYHASDVNGELDLYGLYAIRSGGTPHATWRIFNPSGDTNDIDELVIAGGETGSTPQTNRYRYVSYPAPISEPWRARAFWTLERGGIEQSVAITRDINPVIEHRAFLLAESGGEAVTTRSETWFAPTNAPLAIPVLLARVDDPDGLALGTRWTYDTNAYPPRLLLVEYPDGNWERYDYDLSGRRITRYSPLGNAWTNAPDSERRREVYGYTSVDGRDTGGWEWSDKPRTVTAYEAGVAVSRTYHAYYYTAGGEKVEIEERAATPGAAYGASGNLRTKRTWYAENEAEPWSEELRYVESPGGLLESHVYEAGILDASGPDPAGWSFSADPTGLWVRATADFGTTNAPGGIAFRTRREVTIRDAFDRPLLEESWLCTGETNYTRDAWTATTRDAFGRATAVRRSDGTLAETTWSCCGPESETAADGTVAETAYDALKRPVLTTREGEGAQPDLFTETAYDAAGRITFRRTFSGGLSQSTTNTYDGAGRLTWSRGPDGVETTYSYGSNSTTTVRGGLTNLSVRFADGRAHSTEQNGIRKQTYAYGVDPDGTQWTTVYTGPDATNSLVWQQTLTDPLGHTIAQIRPGYGGALLVTSNFYDTANHLVRTESSSAEGVYAATLFTYDALGNPLLTCQDLDLDGQIDLAGPDRVTGQATRHVEISGDWYEESASWTYPESGSDAPLTNAIARTRLTGLGGTYSADGASGLLTAESVSIDARGNQTFSRTVVDRDNKTVYRLTDTPDSTIAALTVTVNGLVQSSRSTHNLTTAYAYDALGRQTATQDARGAVQSRGYDDAGRVAWESDPATNGTWYAYDALGRRTAVTNALGDVTHTEYDLEGRVVKTYGATYPVEYGYDAFGRMVSMKTFRDEQGAGDETRWFYDEATGLLTNKVYADGKGTAYTYTPDGKLETRNWARGVTTSYAYTNGSMIAIYYSDSTPDVTYQYDRLGRLTRAVTVGVSTNIFTYDGDGAVTSEAVSAGGEHVLTRLRDALGRDGGWTLSAANGLLASASYRYDETGLFEGLSWSNTWDITGVDAAYTREYGLITGRSVRNGAGPLIQTAWNHEIRGLITTIENTVEAGAGANTISRYDYVNDALGRRTAIARSGLAHADMPVHDAYGYNSRSEVASSRRYRGTDHEDTQTPVRGFSFDYDFDAIGNRTSAGTYSPANEARVRTYTANALNQYTQATVPGYASVRGTAVTNATVTVNGLPAWRLDEYFYGESPATNTASPAWQQMRIVAVVNPPGTNDPDVVSCVTGHVFVAQTPEAFTYDDDGNLTGDGRFTYTWDAENRLIGVETRAAAVTAGAPKVRMTYVYDHQSRRVSRRQYAWLQDDWSLSNVQAFRYDGWNLIAETSPSATNLYAWGLDLSGSLQGAGGIGGLLAGVLAKNEEPEARNLVAYAPDANGNVMQLVDATDGTLAAAYEYTPFGETIVSTGPLAKTNPFRFSTKHWDDLTGLGLWGYRYYHPDMGRWLSRDPIWEWKNLMLYSYSDNLTTSNSDYLGLSNNNDPPPVRDPRPQPPTRPLPPPARQPPEIGLPLPPNPDGPVQERPAHVDPCCVAEQLVGDPNDPMSIIFGCTACWKLCSIACKTPATCAQCLIMNPACYGCAIEVIVAMNTCWVEKTCYQCVDGPIKEIKGVRIGSPGNSFGPIYGIPGMSKCIYDTGCGSETTTWVGSQEPCPTLPLRTRIPKTVPCPQ